MRIINAVNVLDGNSYLIAGNNGTEAVLADFDNIYNQKSADWTLDEIFNSVAQEYGVNVNLLKAVAQAESGFDANAVSGCGAMGVMQLMPATAESLGVQDPFDAQQNITGGAKMLAYLLDDYNGNVTLALAAYNAGSGSVQKYGGVPPYSETLGYINKINDILGGALNNDSRTVEGASTTELGGVAGAEAPSQTVPGTGPVTRAGHNSIDYPQGGRITGVSGMTEMFAPVSEEPLLDEEDYCYFKETCAQVLKRFDGDPGVVSEEPESTAAFGLKSDELKETLLLQAESGMQRVMSLSAAQTVDNLLKNSPQSLYEAQASVISPLVAQMRQT